MNAGIMMNPNTGSSKFEYQDLPPEVSRQIYSLAEGEISEPFVMMDPMKNKEVCAIVKVRNKVDVHKANLEDDFQMIRSMLEKKQGDEYIEQWIQNKIKQTFIYIDPEWKDCEYHYQGWIHE